MGASLSSASALHAVVSISSVGAEAPLTRHAFPLLLALGGSDRQAVNGNPSLMRYDRSELGHIDAGLYFVRSKVLYMYFLFFRLWLIR